MVAVEHHGRGTVRGGLRPALRRLASQSPDNGKSVIDRRFDMRPERCTFAIEHRLEPCRLGCRSAIQPEIASRPFIYKEGQVLMRPLGSPDPDPQRPGEPRVDYDIPHVKPWGFDMALYLLTKGIATGAMLLCVAVWLLDNDIPLTLVVGDTNRVK